MDQRRFLIALAAAAPRRGAGGLVIRALALALAALVLLPAQAGALAGYAPSVAETSGPFSANAYIGPARMQLTVDPAQVGPNEMHV